MTQFLYNICVKSLGFWFITAIEQRGEMTIDQIIITAALWCSPEAFKMNIGLINDCRKELVDCVRAISKSDKDIEKKTLDCFLNRKI